MSSILDKEPGSLPMQGWIPLSVPHLAGREWEYVKECLDTGWVSSAGAFVERFENAVAASVGSPYAVATVNGTAAIHVALLAYGVQPEDEVLVPALSFVAPANAIRYVGAWPVFIDPDPIYWQIDPEKVAAFLKNECKTVGGELFNRSTGRRVKAILPVDILGHPVDMSVLLEIARSYGLGVVEDATESLGASYRGARIGALADLSCFSFNGNKIITTGGGGMVVTNDKRLADRVRYLTTQAKDDPVEYVHNEIGFNYRLTNVQAALGVAQMEMLDNYVDIKRTIAVRYRAGLAALRGLTQPCEAKWARSSYWMYTVLVDRQSFGMDSRSLMARLSARRIQSRPLWHPLHRLLPFEKCQAYQIETADILYRDGLSLPCSVGLTEEEQQHVVRVIQG